MAAASCGDDSSSPSSPTSTPAEARVTERFIGTMPAGGSRFYSFSVPTYGTVNLVLNAISGIDGQVEVGLGIGVPNGFECTTSSTINAVPGTAPQLTGPYPAGIYCARVYDLGTLSGAMTFDVTIGHP